MDLFILHKKLGEVKSSVGGLIPDRFVILVKEEHPPTIKVVFTPEDFRGLRIPILKSSRAKRDAILRARMRPQPKWVTTWCTSDT